MLKYLFSFLLIICINQTLKTHHHHKQEISNLNEILKSKNILFNIEVTTGQSSQLKFDFDANLMLKCFENEDNQELCEGFAINNDVTVDEQDETFWLSQALHFQDNMPVIDFRLVDDCSFDVRKTQNAQELAIVFQMTKNFEGVNVKWTIKLRNLYGDEDSNMTEMKEKLSKKMINIQDKCIEMQQHIIDKYNSLEQDSQIFQEKWDQQVENNKQVVSLEQDISKRKKIIQAEEDKIKIDNQNIQKFHLSNKEKSDQSEILRQNIENIKSQLIKLVPAEQKLINQQIDDLIENNQKLKLNSIVRPYKTQNLRHLSDLIKPE